MRDSKTYAGTLEITGVAHLLMMQIHIYKYANENFELLAKFPPNSVTSRRPLLLAYRADNQKNDGHFDLIVTNANQ
jgi:hypothetical protein